MRKTQILKSSVALATDKNREFQIIEFVVACDPSKAAALREAFEKLAAASDSGLDFKIVTREIKPQDLADALSGFESLPSEPEAPAAFKVPVVDSEGRDTKAVVIASSGAVTVHVANLQREIRLSADGGYVVDGKQIPWRSLRRVILGTIGAMTRSLSNVAQEHRDVAVGPRKIFRRADKIAVDPYHEQLLAKAEEAQENLREYNGSPDDELQPL